MAAAVNIEDILPEQPSIKEQRDALILKEAANLPMKLKMKRFLVYGTHVGLFQPGDRISSKKYLLIEDYFDFFRTMLNDSMASEEAMELTKETYIKMIEECLQDDKRPFPEIAIFCLARLAVDGNTCKGLSIIGHHMALIYLQSFYEYSLFYKFITRISLMEGSEKMPPLHRHARKNIKQWYDKQDPDELLKLVTFHAKMNGISHLLLIREARTMLDNFKPVTSKKKKEFNTTQVDRECIYLLVTVGPERAMQIIEKLDNVTFKEMCLKQMPPLIEKYNSYIDLKKSLDTKQILEYKMTLDQAKASSKPLTPEIWLALLQNMSLDETVTNLSDIIKNCLTSAVYNEILTAIKDKLKGPVDPSIISAKILAMKKKYIAVLTELQQSYYSKGIEYRESHPAPEIDKEIIKAVDYVLNKSIFIQPRKHINCHVILALDLKATVKGNRCAWNNNLEPIEAMALVTSLLKHNYFNFNLITYKGQDVGENLMIEEEMTYDEILMVLNNYMESTKHLDSVVDIPALFTWVEPLLAHDTPVVFILLSPLVKDWNIRNLTDSYIKFRDMHEQKRSRLILNSLCDMSIRFSTKKCPAIIDMVGFSNETVAIIEEAIHGRL